MSDKRAAVLGAGSWGTALAKVLAENGHHVRLWGRDPEHVAAMQKDGQNRRYLDGIHLPARLSPWADLKQSVEGAEVVVLAVPSHGLRALATDLGDAVPDGVPLVNAAKGIENGTLQLMGEVLAETLPARAHHQVTHLSGPSFAREVAQHIPTAVCVAGKDPEQTQRAQLAFNNQRLKVYSSDDVVGVELGGALKNVIAIAAGIADGLAFGHNSRAALITRGLAEIGRLGQALGAHPLTLSGLAGMGDLVLTCTGELSRNRHVGIQLGRGQSLQDILDNMTMVAEGVRTAKSAFNLSRREGVEMPIVQRVYEVLYQDLPVEEAFEALMARAPRPERDHVS